MDLATSCPQTQQSGHTGSMTPILKNCYLLKMLGSFIHLNILQVLHVFSAQYT